MDKKIKPRNLNQTELSYIVDEEGNRVYGNPEEMSEILYSSQGIDKDYKGTCGLCAVVNVLRLAGVQNIDEKQVLDYYKKYLGFSWWMYPLIPVFKIFHSYVGETSAKNMKNILKHYGIDSYIIKSVPFKKYGVDGNNSKFYKIRNNKLNEIAEYVEQGRGVIVSFDGLFYDLARYGVQYHAVVITGLKRDSSDRILGFYIHDSNGSEKSKKYNKTYRNEGTIYLNRDEFLQSISHHPINITSSIIR